MLLTVAADLTLDTASLENSLETNQFEESVLTDQTDTGGMGVKSVPAFIAERKNGLGRLQPVENLKRLIGSV
jgi:predicted DsbA family dithiol-disulfide isomerase